MKRHPSKRCTCNGARLSWISVQKTYMFFDDACLWMCLPVWSYSNFLFWFIFLWGQAWQRSTSERCLPGLDGCHNVLPQKPTGQIGIHRLQAVAVSSLHSQWNVHLSNIMQHLFVQSEDSVVLLGVALDLSRWRSSNGQGLLGHDSWAATWFCNTQWFASWQALDLALVCSRP